MAGPVPGIHVFTAVAAKQDVDGRDRHSHDGIPRNASPLRRGALVRAHMVGVSPDSAKRIFAPHRVRGTHRLRWKAAYQDLPCNLDDMLAFDETRKGKQAGNGESKEAVKAQGAA